MDEDSAAEESGIQQCSDGDPEGRGEEDGAAGGGNAERDSEEADEERGDEEGEVLICIFGVQKDKEEECGGEKENEARFKQIFPGADIEGQEAENGNCNGVEDIEGEESDPNGRKFIFGFDGEESGEESEGDGEGSYAVPQVRKGSGDGQSERSEENAENPQADQQMGKKGEFFF